MTVIDPQRMRKEKLQQLRDGNSVYAETQNFIRMIKRGIEKEDLQVLIEEGNGGCWFIPNEKK